MNLSNIKFVEKIINLGRIRLSSEKFLPENYKQIFKNCKSEIRLLKSHKNNTSLVFFETGNFFRKFSQHKSGVKKIEAEIIAFKWYSKKIKKKIVKDYSIKKNQAYLDTYYLHGNKMKSWKSLTNNYSCIIKAISHYQKIFKRKKYHKIHGDLTFDNIFFKKNKVIFFDWEFHNAKKQPWGYDLVYLILSAVCIPYLENKKFSKKDQIYFIKLWKILYNLRINKKLIYDPFNYLEKTIKTDRVFKDSVKISKAKFFPLITPQLFKKQLKNLILKNL